MNLKEHLLQALELLGCDPSRFQFDDHSTIAMNFKDIGDVLLDPLDGHVWMWASLPELPDHAMRGCAFDLLEAISAPTDYLSTGCLALRTNGDLRMVGGPLLNEYVEDPKFLASALESFYMRVLALIDLVK